MTLNIVIPMAGRGSRFANLGFELPKPLIEINGLPMIAWVVENLRPMRDHRFVFLVLQEHVHRYDVSAKLEALAPGSVIVPVDEVTEGAACTVLLGREHFDDDQPLMIANSDQWVTADIDEYLAAGDDLSIDGLIMTMWADHKKWSYAELREDGTVARVVEKEVVSNEATTGVYNFARGRDYVRAADKMIARNLKVNGEFYVAPTYDQLIDEGAKVVVHSIGSVEDEMWGLGTPEDLELFLASAHAARA